MPTLLNPLFLRYWRLVVGFCLLGFLPLTQAQDYLEPERAFVFSAKMVNANTVAVTYVIADAYYMYRERFKFRAVNAKLGAARIPPGKVKFDETFNKDVETHRNKVTIEIPVEASGTFTLVSTSQGCADAGLCYPPLDSEVQLTPVAAGSPNSSISSPLPSGQTPSPEQQSSLNPELQASLEQANRELQSSANSSSQANTSERSSGALASNVEVPPKGVVEQGELGLIQKSLQSGKLLQILPWFFLLGLGLSFTPCVLPMVPILSFIIVGEGASVGRSRSFMLSLTYVLGMALVYTLLGIGAGLAGEGLAARLQNPWVLGTFALLMVGLALSMFGFYQLQVPGWLQAKLTNSSEHQRRGKLPGVFAMGALSALIVGPCVAAPLAGTLLFISQSRDLVIGGSALFALAIGMGVPLLMVGASAGSLLPKVGHWMESVERFFGVLMLGTALWMVSPVLPGSLQLLGWAALCLGYGAYLIWSKDGHWPAKAFGLTFAILGGFQLLGFVSGGHDPLAPLANLRAETSKMMVFQRVKSVAELEAVIAQNKGRPVMLDFYADWCVSCKEMEKFTFSESPVQAKLANAVLLQADVTQNSPEDKALLKRFQLFGPPGIIFFDAQGQEVSGQRVVGYQNTEKFLASLAATGLF